MRDQRGFTLLELLMVVIIIAILASIALPQYLRVAERARAGEALTVLAAVRSSELRYKANDPNGAFTIDLNLLDTSIPGFGTGPDAVPLSPNWTYWSDATIAAASRSGGAYGGELHVDLNGSASCATNPVWGLTAC